MVVTLEEERRLRMFRHRVLRKMFGPWRKAQETGENCIMRSFMIVPNANMVGW
jgi:hypothetical protein